MAMRLNFLRSIATKDPQKTAVELEKVEELAKRTSREIRSMLFTLRPLLLETKGLGPAIETMMHHISESDSIEMRLIGGDKGSILNKTTQGVVFSIIEEALSNARKHAEADVVEVHLWQEEDLFVARISDDGIGFDPQAVRQDYESRGSLGMVNMEERANRIDGSLRVESTPESGTTVILVVPLATQGHQEMAVA
jgi:signal transduction histidine kinase